MRCSPTSASGKVEGVIASIDAVHLKTSESQLPTIRALPAVAAGDPDAVRTGAPVDTVTATDFLNGFNTWDLDAVDVTNLQPGPDES